MAMNKSQKKEACLICGAATFGLRFQVNCCRACAAFFRRSVKSKISYKCQKDTGLCDTVTQRPICRYCRLKKCIALGIKLEKDGPLGNKKMIEDGFGAAKMDSASSSTMPIDTSNNNFIKVLGEIQRIFEEKKTLSPKTSFTNITKDFANVLTTFLNTTKPKPPLTLLKEFDHQDRHIFLGNYLTNIARMISEFEYFAVLDPREKLAMYKRFWPVFQQLERSYQSVQYFGDDWTDTRAVAGTSHYVDLADVSRLFPEGRGGQDAKIFVMPMISKVPLMLTSLKKLEITVVELAYIALTALWSCYELDEISDLTRVIADDVLNKIADGLHQYYVKELHMSNYALRQAQLINCLRISEFRGRDRKQLITANSLFSFTEKGFNFSAFI